MSLGFTAATTPFVLAHFNLLTPNIILAFTFLIGCGMALFGPSWQVRSASTRPRPPCPPRSRSTASPLQHRAQLRPGDWRRHRGHRRKRPRRLFAMPCSVCRCSPCSSSGCVVELSRLPPSAPAAPSCRACVTIGALAVAAHRAVGARWRPASAAPIDPGPDGADRPRHARRRRAGLRHHARRLRRGARWSARSMSRPCAGSSAAKSRSGSAC